MREKVFVLEMRLQIYFLLSLTQHNEAQFSYHPFSGIRQQFSNLFYDINRRTNNEGNSFKIQIGFQNLSEQTTTVQPNFQYQNYQPQACQGIFSLQQDRNGYFGLVTIANPDYYRNILNVELSVAARITNVSTRTISYNQFAILFEMKLKVKL